MDGPFYEADFVFGYCFTQCSILCCSVLPHAMASTTRPTLLCVDSHGPKTPHRGIAFSEMIDPGRRSGGCPEQAHLGHPQIANVFVFAAMHSITKQGIALRPRTVKEEHALHCPQTSDCLSSDRQTSDRPRTVCTAMTKPRSHTSDRRPRKLGANWPPLATGPAATGPASCNRTSNSAATTVLAGVVAKARVRASCMDASISRRLVALVGSTHARSLGSLSCLLPFKVTHMSKPCLAA